MKKQMIRKSITDFKDGVTENQSLIKGIFLISLLCALLADCNKEPYGKDKGLVKVSFANGYDYYETMLSKVSEGILPDTNDFILTVVSTEDEKVIFNDSYGNKPEKMALSEGSYEFSVISDTFEKPSFANPQYGDFQQVIVKAQEKVDVNFNCAQINAGLRFEFTEDFKKTYPMSTIVIESETYELEYGFNERRIAYFKPSKVIIYLKENNEKHFVTYRSLKAAEVLTLKFNASVDDFDKNRGVSITLDTSRHWMSENIIIGGDSQNDGKSKESAYNVSEATYQCGDEDVWVKGYIVGGDLSTSKINFYKPFSSSTHLAISDNYPESMRMNCMVVELKSGKIRDALNLVNNYDNLGKLVYLKGDIVSSYFDLPGIKSVSEYEIPTEIVDSAPL